MANGVNSPLDAQVTSNLLSPKIKIVWYLENRFVCTNYYWTFIASLYFSK